MAEEPERPAGANLNLVEKLRATRVALSAYQHWYVGEGTPEYGALELIAYMLDEAVDIADPDND